jgi:hypothetical protein
MARLRRSKIANEVDTVFPESPYNSGGKNAGEREMYSSRLERVGDDGN